MKHHSKDLGLVGIGYWGKNLARNFRDLGALHSLCDSRESALAEYGEDYGGVQKWTSYEQMLASPDITKIAIAVPAALHFKLARQALTRGKDVYVEKPLCLDLAEAEELVRIAEQHRRILMVGHLLQYHPCVVRMQQLIADGELGRLQYVTSNRLNLGKFREEEDSLWSFAPHDISVILSMFGNQIPDEVSCFGGSYLTPGIADVTLTTMKFAGACRAHVHVSWLNPFKEQRLAAVGSKGMMVFDDTRSWPEKLRIHRDYLQWNGGRHPTANLGQGEYLAIEQNEPLREECSHFLECCETRIPPRTDGMEGVRVLRVLMMASASLQRNGEVQMSRTESVVSDYFAHQTAIVDEGASIGSGTKIWHYSHIMAGAELGERCNIGQNVVISASVKLGQNVKVQNNVSIYTGAVVEDDVFLGPSCVLTNISNPRSQIKRHSVYERTVIRRGATVGANATVVCGVTLGRYSFIAAGAVVSRDVPDYGLAVGVPARVSGWMSRHGHPLRFDSTGHARCPESGFDYELANGAVRCLTLGEDEALPEEMAIGTKYYEDFK